MLGKEAALLAGVVAIAVASMMPAVGLCAEPDLNVVPPSGAASEAPVAIDLMEVVITGNTVLDKKLLEDTVEPFLGPDRNLDEIDSLRQALEGVYREQGYRTASVRIPKQVARDGVVRLEVIEGQVGRLNVIGSRYHSLERIKALAPSLASGSVPDFDRLQQDLIALNSVPDLRVTPALKAGLRPNTVDVDLAADDSLPAHGALEVNNRHSQDTAELRSQVMLSYADLWQRGHTMTLTYQMAPEEPDQSAVYFGAYIWRFRTSPASVMVNYIKSDSDISTVGGINVLGKGEIAGLRLYYPLEGTDTLYPTLSAGVDYKRFINTTALPDAGQGAKSFSTPLTYYPMTLGLGLFWRHTESVTQSDLSFNYASSQLGSEPSQLDDNRYRARGQQFSIRETLSHSHELPLGLAVGGRFAAQLTDQPLITTEQFSAGGADSVRGYLESAALGDQGFFESIELRAPSIADLASIRGIHLLKEMRAFTFYDAAQLKVRDTLPEQTENFRLESWGYGIRFALPTALDGAVQWAEPLRDLPGKPPETGRLLFRVAGTF